MGSYWAVLWKPPPWVLLNCCWVWVDWLMPKILFHGRSWSEMLKYSAGWFHQVGACRLKKKKGEKERVLGDNVVDRDGRKWQPALVTNCSLPEACKTGKIRGWCQWGNQGQVVSNTSIDLCCWTLRATPTDLQPESFTTEKHIEKECAVVHGGCISLYIISQTVHILHFLPLLTINS